MFLSFHKEMINLGFNHCIQIASGILYFGQRHIRSSFEVRFKLFEGHRVIKFKEVLQNLISFEFWDLNKFVEKHLEDHHSLVEMFIIISSELAFLGDGRNRHSRMKIFQSTFEPQKIIIPSFNSFA